MESCQTRGGSGLDFDTIACIAGGIAQAYYKNIPEYIANRVLEKLPNDLLELTVQFNEKFKCEF